MTSPTDAAWDVLQEGHRVEKILPLLAAGALAYGGYQGAKNAGVRVNRDGISLDDEASIVDPTGGYLYDSGAIDDPTGAQRAMAFATQAVPFGAPALKVGGKAFRVARGARAADKATDATRAAQQSANFARTSAKNNPGATALNDARFAQASKAHQRAIAARAKAAKLGQAGGRGKYALAGAGGAVAGALGSRLLDLTNNNEQQVPQMTGMSPGYAGAGAGASGTGGYQLDQAGGGIGGVQNVGVGQGARQDIWNDVNWNQQQPDPFANVQWQDPNSQASSQKLTGEYMDLGEFLLKSAINDMERKASCPNCGKMEKMCGCEKKAECPKCGKNCKCDTKKADSKKKPAHGMVIVIGSGKAGPGPSTEGKRDKKKE